PDRIVFFCPGKNCECMRVGLGNDVAFLGLGKSGAANAALLSIAILALNDDALGQKLKDYRRSMAAEVERASQGIKEIL
ncbi:MAG: hypothetical protein KJ727_03910, partial [Acidobacteria bacterium]|nr:hypothetical protein [Acidobacteriota bacterium]